MYYSTTLFPNFEELGFISVRPKSVDSKTFKFYKEIGDVYFADVFSENIYY